MLRATSSLWHRAAAFHKPGSTAVSKAQLVAQGSLTAGSLRSPCLRPIATLSDFWSLLRPTRTVSAHPAFLAALDASARSPTPLSRSSLVRTWARARLEDKDSSAAVAELIRTRADAVARSCAKGAAWAEALVVAPSGRTHAAAQVWEALGQVIADSLAWKSSNASRASGDTETAIRCGIDDLARISCAFAVAAPPGPARDSVLDAVAASAESLIKDVGSHVRSEASWRRAAWACAAAGRAHRDVFGLPDVKADPTPSKDVWDALERLVASCGQASENASPVLQLADRPFPVVMLSAWLSESEGQQLLSAADVHCLWETSPLAAADSGGCSFEAAPLRTSESAVLSASRGLTGETLQVVDAVRARAAEAFGLPDNHIEALQLVRYRPGARYAPHVDWGKAEEDITLWLAGQRVATALVYISSHGGGGATHFTKLGLRVQPRPGAALLWPNVTREGEPLPETEHEAEPAELRDDRSDSAVDSLGEHGQGGLQSSSATPLICKVALNIWARDRPLPGAW